MILLWWVFYSRDIDIFSVCVHGCVREQLFANLNIHKCTMSLYFVCPCGIVSGYIAYNILWILRVLFDWYAEDRVFSNTYTHICTRNMRFKPQDRFVNHYTVCGLGIANNRCALILKTLAFACVQYSLNIHCFTVVCNIDDFV